MQEDWEEIKNSKKDVKNNSSFLYFKNKEDLKQLVYLLNQVLENTQESFLNDRMLLISSSIEELEGNDGKKYNKWELLYKAIGTHKEEAFLTTNGNGELVNIIDLPTSEIIGTSEKIINEVEKGTKKINEYEKQFLYDSYEEVSIKRNEEKTMLL